MKHDFEERRQARIEGLHDAAAAAGQRGAALVHTAHSMAGVIPFGQPILVGHHSEGRDRRYRDRVQNKFAKGYAEIDRSQRLAQRAASAAANTAIFSDDPKAEEKLADKITRLEKRRDLYKQINKCIRARDLEAFLDLGLSEAQWQAFSRPDDCGRIGIADYKFTNLGATIRAARQRLAAAQSRSADVTTSQTIGAIRIVSNVEANRTQVFFPGIPSEETRARLQQNGFRWCRGEGAWQRHLSAHAGHIAAHIAQQAGRGN